MTSANTWRRLEIGLLGCFAPNAACADATQPVSAGRPPAAGLSRSNSFNANSFGAPGLLHKLSEQRPRFLIRHRPLHQREGLLSDGIQGQPPAQRLRIPLPCQEPPQRRGQLTERSEEDPNKRQERQDGTRALGEGLRRLARLRPHC